MKIARTIEGLRAALETLRTQQSSIGFAPTMGALHDGHLSLVRIARSRDDAVVLSIFVNPLQFGPSEDLSAYPRSEDADLAAAESSGVDLAFLPSVEEMYPPGRSTEIQTGAVAEPLEGASRPGHFAGVATVVAKLLNLVQPDALYLGQKDAQQVAVIKTMVRDLSFPVDVVVCPTVREADGLALSSRNAYLDEEERTRATVLWRALEAGGQSILAREPVAVVERKMRDIISSERGVELDYAAVVDPDSFGPPDVSASVLLVVAARVGTARLIDNVRVDR